MEAKLMADLKDAMKSGDTIRKNTIQQIRSAVLLAKKEKGTITDLDIENVIMKEKNKRIDALAQFEKAQRQDLIDQTNRELFVVNSYLPQPLSEVELELAIQKIITEENITDNKLMGYVIKKAKEQIGNRASGKQISDMVKKLLV